MSSNEVVNVLGVQVEINSLGLGNFLKVKGEKKGSRPLKIDPKHIRNSQMRNVVQCIRLIRYELKKAGMSPQINHCSFQLICAFVSNYLREPKMQYTVRVGYACARTKSSYPQRVYDLAKTIQFLAFEFNF